MAALLVIIGQIKLLVTLFARSCPKMSGAEMTHHAPKCERSSSNEAYEYARATRMTSSKHAHTHTRARADARIPHTPHTPHTPHRTWCMHVFDRTSAVNRQCPQKASKRLLPCKHLRRWTGVRWQVVTRQISDFQHVRIRPAPWPSTDEGGVVPRLVLDDGLQIADHRAFRMR